MGDYSLPFGCINVTSYPTTPFRIPPGAKRTPVCVVEYDGGVICRPGEENN